MPGSKAQSSGFRVSGVGRSRTVELRVYFRIQGLCLNSGYVLGVPVIRTIVSWVS